MRPARQWHDDVGWRLLAGLAVGLLVGRVAGWLAFRVAPAGGIADAFMGLGLMLTAYGAAEAVQGYGSWRSLSPQSPSAVSKRATTSTRTFITLLNRPRSSV